MLSPCNLLRRFSKCHSKVMTMKATLLLPILLALVVLLPLAEAGYRPASPGRPQLRRERKLTDEGDTVVSQTESIAPGTGGAGGGPGRDGQGGTPGAEAPRGKGCSCHSPPGSGGSGGGGGGGGGSGSGNGGTSECHCGARGGGGGGRGGNGGGGGSGGGGGGGGGGGDYGDYGPDYGWGGGWNSQDNIPRGNRRRF